MAVPIISIIVPTYNRAKMLPSALSCLIDQKTGGEFVHEVVVVDDMSDDDTPEVVADFVKKSKNTVRYVLGEGRGYTHALNTGLAAAKGNYLVFFDDDQLAHSSWLLELYKVAVSEKADLVGGPITLRIPPEVRSEMGPVYRDMCGETHDIIFPERYVDSQPLPAGGNRLVRRAVFEQLGDFDEDMLTGGCDREFLLRALDAGCSTGWATGGNIEHVIPLNRITPAHMKWYSLQWGCSFAYVDWKRSGRGKIFFACLARIGQALLVNLPVFLFRRLKGDNPEMRDRAALLWRAVGYTRKTLNFLAPGWFTQEHFFSRVEFRRSRASESA